MVDSFAFATYIHGSAGAVTSTDSHLIVLLYISDRELRPNCFTLRPQRWISSMLIPYGAAEMSLGFMVPSTSGPSRHWGPMGFGPDDF